MKPEISLSFSEQIKFFINPKKKTAGSYYYSDGIYNSDYFEDI